MEDAERSFLGCIMQTSRYIYSVMNQISVSDFILEKHRKIYAAMLDFASQGIDFDVFKLESYFYGRNEAYVCERQLLFEIKENSPAIGLDFYAKQIKVNTKLRKMYDFLNGSLNAINDKKGDAGLILEEIDKNYNLLGGQINEEGPAHISKVIHDYKKEWEAGIVSDAIPTGFVNLDYYITGMKPGQMITIAAPTSQGKTAFALNITVNAAEQGKRVAFFTMEMKAKELLQRLVCAKAAVNSKLLDNIPLLSNEEAAAVSNALNKLNDLNIYFDDNGSLDADKVRARCQQMKMEKGGLDLVIIDYLQLMQAGDAENRTVAVTNISNKIKQMAISLNVPVLCLSQLNRDMYKNKEEPELYHLRDSGSIEQDSDIVVFLFVKKNDPNNKVTLKIAKNRGGQKGYLSHEFIGENYLFRDWTVSRQPDAQGYLPP